MMSIPLTCRASGQITAAEKQLFQESFYSLRDPNTLKIFEDQFEFHGFQSPKTKSLDEEVLTNMHFILKICSSEQGVLKLCIERKSRASVNLRNVGLVTDYDSAVIINPRKGNTIDCFFFSKQGCKKWTMSISGNTIGQARLFREKLFISFMDYDRVINFKGEDIIEKTFSKALLLSTEMAIFKTYNRSDDNLKTIIYDDLQKSTKVKLIRLPDEWKNHNFGSYNDNNFVIIQSFGITYWVVQHEEGLVFYRFIKEVNELKLLKKIKLLNFVDGDGSRFRKWMYCERSQRIFLVYMFISSRIIDNARRKYYLFIDILVFDIISFKVSSVLHTELKYKRQNAEGQDVDVNMLSSKDSDKLFITVNVPRNNITYEEFVLPPQDISLLNITMNYVKTRMDQKIVKGANIPRNLKELILNIY